MAKLTKKEQKQHNQIIDLVESDRPLTFEEKLFIIENYHEGATVNNAELGSFFTRSGLLAISPLMLVPVEALLTFARVSVGCRLR